MDHFWKNKKVLITGHTGFKGSWLSYWLYSLGANVYGYSLGLPTTPNHYELLKLDINETYSDIRDLNTITEFVKNSKPEIVFHLAAQPLVRLSYQEPATTFSTNVMGTLNLFEACRPSPSVKAIINVTSDKCYENFELQRGYHENDRMGGHDPYSASKGCAELLTSSYRNSFFNITDYGKKHNILLASCRTGNVIGGGDWATDRLIPDLIKASQNNTPVELRNPNSTRPWQHVLDPLFGYLSLGKKLLEGQSDFAEPWNFGPLYNESLTVKEIASRMKQHWKKISYTLANDSSYIHEAKLLHVDSTKANSSLNWQPKWNSVKSINKTVNWYKNFYENNTINTASDISDYTHEIKTQLNKISK